jgi:hypothetical protein
MLINMFVRKIATCTVVGGTCGIPAYIYYNMVINDLDKDIRTLKKISDDLIRYRHRTTHPKAQQYYDDRINVINYQIELRQNYKKQNVLNVMFGPKLSIQDARNILIKKT